MAKKTTEAKRLLRSNRSAALSAARQSSVRRWSVWSLNKMHRQRTTEDTPAVRGMIRAVQHLVRVVDEK